MLDTVHEFKHSSGLNVIFVQKPGFNERYAMFSTKYGAIDSYLKNTATGGRMDVPSGIAHFLEHKLFEEEEGTNIMLEYSRMGVVPNAFTSSVQTSYLFSCANNFEKCLRYLLEYVQNPFFTEENVEKEKGIIGQEINMYLDNPDSVIYMNLMRALYVNHPVRNDVAGSIESISHITPEILYFLYDTFYTPENMVLVVVGDEKFSDIEKIVNECITDKWKQRKRTGYVSDLSGEPYGICEKVIRRKMDVSAPMFMYGYKDSDINKEPLELIKKELEVKMLLDVLFGKSSEFYDELYNEGLINDTFYTFYELERSFAFVAFGGESKDPEALSERIQRRIWEAKRGQISEKDFNRIKNSSYGAFIKRLNSVEGVCRLYTNAHMANISVIDYSSLYDKIEFNSALEQLKVFDESKAALSIVE